MNGLIHSGKVALTTTLRSEPQRYTAEEREEIVHLLGQVTFDYSLYDSLELFEIKPEWEEHVLVVAEIIQRMRLRQQR